MNKSTHKAVLLFSAVIVSIFGAATIYAATALGTVTTNSATSIQDTGATLNGSVTNIVVGTTVWFQYGASTTYGMNTNVLPQVGNGNFSQNLTGLTPNTTYHYRAVVQDSYGTSYGSDMTFTTTNSGTSTTPAPVATTSGLTVSKSAIDLTKNNLSWQNSVNACPGDVLAFAITLQAGSQDIHNVVLKDSLASNLTYIGDLTNNATLDTVDNPTSGSGMNIGTILANNIVIVSYQVRVAQASSFTSYPTTLSNNATITSTEGGTQTISSAAIINAPDTQTNSNSPTEISTGLTNGFLADSFFLPLLLITLMSYLYFTGKVYSFADWLKQRI